MERNYFFSTHIDQKINFLYLKSEIYFSKNFYEKAYYTLHRINITEIKSDSLKAKILYKKTLNAYLFRQFDLVYLNINDYYSETDDTLFDKKINFLEILTLNEENKWNDAFGIINKYYIKYSKDSLKYNILKTKYLEKNQPRLKNKHLSAKLGLFVPGGPYFYNGFINDGLLNVGLEVAGLGIAGFYAFVVHQYIASVAIGLYFFNRFYNGAQRKSDFLVEKRNYIRTKAYNEELKVKIAKFLFE